MADDSPEIPTDDAVATLRDLLAAHALQGILAGWHKELHPNTEGIAEAAWAYADAMLASRSPKA